LAFSLIPREEKFFDLFDQQAQWLKKSASLFKDLAREWRQNHPALEQLREVEHECDITTHEIIDMLNRTFVTPIDREDIHELAKIQDDVVDIIQAVSERLQLFNIQSSTKELLELAEILEESITNVTKAVSSIRDINRPRRILDYCIEINRLENRGDRTYERAIGDLFNNSSGDVLNVIKWKDIYDAAEQAIDKCEDIANTIESIVVKNG
jgi:predicted phosphate transport protein (TIGR00153 family)